MEGKSPPAWAKTWPDWPSYAAFWSQVVRWALRPAEHGNLTLNVRRDEGRLKIVVDALDKDNQFLNFLEMQASVLGPDHESHEVERLYVADGSAVPSALGVNPQMTIMAMAHRVAELIDARI